ncbi:tetratricopeptide repeat-containing sensor histidine kinase [Marinoscillum furvescens]|uniref:histidine kinase n=1 Tax=Marinoscillum furvescens DSM 4134 TaxID=1122208 RepID=A0A3D9L774_MARFU|nr:tetratricopeptide repeat-containing sensor histidine kinase [Marinoscillum furvescens]REE01731.1 signal transduction histidine kinase [Marinoscillum furvescens DSM 4134]
MKQKLTFVHLFNFPLKKFLFSFCMVFISSGSLSAQRTEFLDSLHEATRSEDSHVRLNAYARLIQEYAMKGNMERALEFGDSVIRKTSTDETSLGYAKLLSNLGICYRIVGKFDSSAHYFYQSYMLAEQEGYRQSQALTMTNLSSLLSDFNQYDSSIALLKRAIPILTELQDSLGMANAYNNLGNKYSTLGDHAAALRNQFVALNIYEGLAAWRNYLVCLISLGNTYKNMNDLENSVVYYQQALSGDSLLTDEYLGNIYVNWAESLLKMQKPEEAIGKLNLCMQHWSESNCFLMYPLAHKAQAYLDLGVLDSTRYYAEKSMKEAQSCKERSVVSANQIVLGNYYAELGRKAKAQRLWEKAYSIADSVGRTDLKRDASRALYEYYKEGKDWEKSLVYLEKFKSASDSLLNKEQIQNTAKLETEFAFQQDKKEMEFAIASEQARADRAESERRNLFVLVLVIVVFLIVVVYLINRNRLNERRSKIILNEQNAQLEALNNAKEKMISLLSHDIRNPLFGLEGSLNMLLEGGLDEERFRQSVIQTRHRLRSVSEFLDNMLKWAKSQLSGINPQFRNVDASQLMKDTIELLHTSIAAKELKVENNLNEKVFVRADAEMIQTVIRNVLSNAVKYTPRGNKITLNLEEMPGEFLFSIEDEGIGLPDEDIFDLGATFDSGTEGEAGTGLGLSLSREFVETHQGKIWAEPHGNGTVVKFTLPRN